MPEKKAENNKLNMMIMALDDIYLAFFSVHETLLKFFSKKENKNCKGYKKQGDIGTFSISVPLSNSVISK
jgi:hypothetical protein